MTDEMRELRLRWQNHRQALLRADYNHADEELARSLYFAEHTPIIAGILRQLRSIPLYREFSAEQWRRARRPAGGLGAGRTNLGFSLDGTERAAQCLKVLEWAVGRFDQGEEALYAIGLTTYGGRGSGITEHVRSAIETVFEPFYRYVDTELRAQETLITPTDVMREIQNLVDGEASVRYPESHRLLLDTYRQLFGLTAASCGASWYAVGYSCRQTLVRFADEVFNPDYVPEGQDQPKKDDARMKLKWTVRHHLKRVGVGDRYRESMETIIQANWDFVSVVGHRQQSVTEEDARLAVIYTYLTISLVDRVLTHDE